MAAAAAAAAAEGPANDLAKSNELQFYHQTSNSSVPHKSVTVGDSFYFNPTVDPDEGQKEVNHLAFGLTEGKYFVLPFDKPMNLTETFTVRNETGKEAIIGIYPGHKLPLHSKKEAPNQQAMCNNITARINWLDNTQTRAEAQAQLPTVRQAVAQQEIDALCQGQQVHFIDPDLQQGLAKFLCEEKKE